MVMFTETYQRPVPKPMKKTVRIRHHIIKSMTRSEREVVVSGDFDHDVVAHAQKARRGTPNKEKKLEKGTSTKTKKYDNGNVRPSSLSQGKHRHSNAVRFSHPLIPTVVGSPILSPVQSKKSLSSDKKQAASSAPESVKTTSSAWFHNKKERLVNSKRPHSAYAKTYTNKSKFAHKGIQISKSTTPPNTPEQRPNSAGKIDDVEEIPLPEIVVESQETTSSSNAETDTTGSDSAVNGGTAEEKKRRNRISSADFQKLGLRRRPRQFKYEATVPTLCLTNPVNPEPLRSNVFVSLVPKRGYEVKTPFYMHLDVQRGALRDDVIMKFEVQSYELTKLELESDEKLCSQVIDINMTPLAYCLHQEAIVKMRIVEECINDFEDVTIVTARHFNWSALPTHIETRDVGQHGEVHYYAVSSTKYLGKFAVITTPKINSFVMTPAGGTFESTVTSEVTVHIEENAVRRPSNMLDLSITEIREEGIIATKEEIKSIKGVNGQLIVSSHVIDVSKESMRKHGQIDNLPNHVNLTVPINREEEDEADIFKDILPWNYATIKIMHKLPITEDRELSPFRPKSWEDITADQEIAPDPLLLQDEGNVQVKAHLPSQVLVLVFNETNRRKPSITMDTELDQVCEALIRNNRVYDVALMVHQRSEQPEMIRIHVVRARAAMAIAKTMEVDGEWVPVDSTLIQQLRMEEREHLRIRFKGQIRLTINQLEPEIQFHSRRWQGFQYQVEATEESYSRSSTNDVTGFIEFIQIADDEENVVHTSDVTIPRDRAKPYKPLVVTRPTPKVNIYREYKLAWMKNLSKMENQKYRDINTP